MMKSAALALPLAAALLASSAAIGSQWSTASDSTLGFSAAAQGESFDGVFKRFDANIRFAPDALAGSRFEVEIDLTSVDSQNSERDEMLADAAFFDSASQPTASYFAERFVALEDGRFRAEGTLTLRGISLPVPLEFSWGSDGATATLAGEADLDRLAFKVGDGEWADADAIALTVRVITALTLTAAPSSTP